MHRILRGTLAATLLLVVAMLAACAPATVSSTNRARDYVAKPGRLYVIYLTNLAWGREFETAFRDRFRQIAAQCGTVTEFESYTGLELEERGMLDRAVAFRADTILTITHGGGVVMMPEGRRVSVQYATSLRDMHESRTVWRGKFDFGRGGTVIPIEERAQVFAIELSNSLKQDQMLRGCTQIALGPNGRLTPGNGAPATGPAAAVAPAAPKSVSQAPGAAPAAQVPRTAAAAPVRPGQPPAQSSAPLPAQSTAKASAMLPGNLVKVTMADLEGLLPTEQARPMPTGPSLPASPAKVRMGDLESLLPTQ